MLMVTATLCSAVLALVTTFPAIAGIGCNTAHGFGKDMESAGESIQKCTR